jgi:hypothetical protein
MGLIFAESDLIAVCFWKSRGSDDAKATQFEPMPTVGAGSCEVRIKVGTQWRVICPRRAEGSDRHARLSCCTAHRYGWAFRVWMASFFAEAQDFVFPSFSKIFLFTPQVVGTSTFFFVRMA